MRPLIDLPASSIANLPCVGLMAEQISRGDNVILSANFSCHK
jgi:hypothetical protein